MADLGRELLRWRGRHVCLCGVGQAGAGDDGLGLRLAAAVQERLAGGGAPGAPVEVLLAGLTPERLLGRLADGRFDEVVFLDAVELGGAPGDALLLGADEIAARFPQVSTHRLSLGLIARLVEGGGARAASLVSPPGPGRTTRAWLLGVQPATLRPGSAPSPAVEGTLDALAGLLAALELPHVPLEVSPSPPTVERAGVRGGRSPDDRRAPRALPPASPPGLEAPSSRERVRA